MSETGYKRAIQDIEQALASMPVSEIPTLTGELKRLDTQALARLIQRPEPDHRNLLDAKQVAVRLNVKESYVLELARRKELNSVKMGKYRKFTEASLKAYLAKQGG